MAMVPENDGDVDQFYINDVGAATWEEISLSTQPMQNFGHSVREGPCLYKRSDSDDCFIDDEFTDPVHWWRHGAELTATTGGTVVPADAMWPEELTGQLIYTDLKFPAIFHLRNGNSAACRGVACVNQVSDYTPTPIVEGLENDGNVLRIRFMPFQGISTFFFLVFSRKGRLYRISAAEGTNRQPTAVIRHFLMSSSDSALTVRFDGWESVDPNPDDVLSYQWDFF